MTHVSARVEMTLWAESVFPHQLGAGETFVIAPYWQSTWPQPAPQGRSAWSPVGATSHSELMRYVVQHGSTLNLGVALAFFKPLEGRVTRTVQAFSRAGGLAVDLDCGLGKPYGNAEEATGAALAFSRRTGIEPSALVSTGTGVQAYFTLEEPCTDGALFESMLRRLMAALKGDRGAGGRTRIMRPPCSLNFKYDPPAVVRLISAAPRTTPWSTFDAVLPADPNPPVNRRRRSTRSAAPELGEGRIIIPKSPEIRSLLNGQMPERYHNDASRRDFFVACALAESGAGIEDIVATMAASALGNQATRKPNADYYLRHTAEQAVERTSSRHSREARRRKVGSGTRRRTLGAPR